MNKKPIEIMSPAGSWESLQAAIQGGANSVYFGMAHETLALFGFGLDSFVEVISGVGIWHMVLRIRQNGDEHRDKFEKTALKITGTVFYLLAVGLLVTSIYNLINGSKPENTLWGVIIASISILVMWWLIYNKKKISRVAVVCILILGSNSE